MLIDRRSLLKTCAGGMLGCMRVGKGAAASPRDLRFRVLRKGSPIGMHVVAFREAEPRLMVSTTIDLKVRVAFVTAFHFRHHSEEDWIGAKLVSIRSRTDDNGKVYELAGAAVRDGFRTVGPAGPFVSAPDLLTSNAVWNPDFVKQRQVIDAQEGGEIGLSARQVADEALSGAPGAPVATKYRVVMPHCAGYVWYGRDGRWLRGIFEIKGETLVYEAA